THASFASTNPNVSGQDLAYNYDAQGNRTSTVTNGVITAYAANSLNEYTSIGGATPTYDADGNLLTEGTATYTYDQQDRLISVTSSFGSIAYSYDALGNRSSSTINGH